MPRGLSKEIQHFSQLSVRLSNQTEGLWQVSLMIQDSHFDLPKEVRVGQNGQS